MYTYITTIYFTAKGGSRLEIIFYTPNLSSSKDWCTWINQSLDHDCPSENHGRSSDMSQSHDILLPTRRARCPCPSRNLKISLPPLTAKGTRLFILFVPQTDCKFCAIHMGHRGTWVIQIVQTSPGVR